MTFNSFIQLPCRRLFRNNFRAALVCGLLSITSSIPVFAFEAPQGIDGAFQSGKTAVERKSLSRDDLARMRLNVHESAPRPLSTEERRFIEAAASSDIESVRKALSEGVNIHAREAGGDSALMLAVRAGNLEIVRELLAKGAWPSSRAVDGFTPLTFAARRGHAPITGELLRAGARTEELTAGGDNALTLAVMFGHWAVVRELMIHGADSSVQSGGKTVYEGQPPLVMAAVQERADILQVLLQHGANPNIRDRDMQTALQWALLKGNREISEFLLASGSDPQLLPIGICLFYFEPKLSLCR
jgi:hypothetical protein